jgi:hypothetical protein
VYTARNKKTSNLKHYGHPVINNTPRKNISRVIIPKSPVETSTLERLKAKVFRPW